MLIEVNMNNNSQLENLKLSSREQYEKTFRRIFVEDAPWGTETPLGHTYGLVYGALLDEGIDVNPDSKEFLDFIGRSERIPPRPFELSLFSPTFHERRTQYKGGRPDFPEVRTFQVLAYMLNKGLSSERCSEVMDKVLGPIDDTFSPRMIKLYNVVVPKI